MNELNNQQLIEELERLFIRKYDYTNNQTEIFYVTDQEHAVLGQTSAPIQINEDQTHWSYYPITETLLSENTRNYIRRLNGVNASFLAVNPTHKVTADKLLVLIQILKAGINNPDFRYGRNTERVLAFPNAQYNERETYIDAFKRIISAEPFLELAQRLNLPRKLVSRENLADYGERSRNPRPRAENESILQYELYIEALHGNDYVPSIPVAYRQLGITTEFRAKYIGEDEVSYQETCNWFYSSLANREALNNERNRRQQPQEQPTGPEGPERGDGTPTPGGDGGEQEQPTGPEGPERDDGNPTPGGDGGEQEQPTGPEGPERGDGNPTPGGNGGEQEQPTGPERTEGNPSPGTQAPEQAPRRRRVKGRLRNWYNNQSPLVKTGLTIAGIAAIAVATAALINIPGGFIPLALNSIKIGLTGGPKGNADNMILYRCFQHLPIALAEIPAAGLVWPGLKTWWNNWRQRRQERAANDGENQQTPGTQAPQNENPATPGTQAPTEAPAREQETPQNNPQRLTREEAEERLHSFLIRNHLAEDPVRAYAELQEFINDPEETQEQKAVYRIYLETVVNLANAAGIELNTPEVEQARHL